MFFTWYRDIIAKQVENKMLYLDTCLNDKNIILNVISPKTYKRKPGSLCSVCLSDGTGFKVGLKHSHIGIKKRF